MKGGRGGEGKGVGGGEEKKMYSGVEMGRIYIIEEEIKNYRVLRAPPLF